MNNSHNDIITVVRDPKNTLGKRFVLNKDGSIDKPPGVNVSRGEAIMHHVPDHASLAKLLTEISEDPHAAFINASFIGIELGEPFLLYSEDLISKEFKFPGAPRDKTKGIHYGSNRGKPIKVTGRLKENVIPSSWQFIDRDIDEHTPENYASIDLDGYIAAVDKLLPGFANTDKVFAGSTSARVLKDGEPVSNGNGHIWFKFDNHKDVERVRAALLVRAAELGMTWMKPRYSNDTGEVCGHSLATILDYSVFNPGRLIFSGKPVVAEGLEVKRQSVHWLSGANSSVDTSQLTLPAQDRVREITKAAGVEMSIQANGTGSLVCIAKDLTLATELETTEYGTITIDFAYVLDLGKVRCQTPFRESSSMAAFLDFDKYGDPFVHDVGTATTHRLTSLDKAKLEFRTPCLKVDTDQDTQAEITVNERKHKPFKYYNTNDLLSLPPITWLVKGIIPSGGLGVLYGESGSGKTFIALDLVMRIVRGEFWHDRKVKQAGVLYLAAEGSAGLSRRMAAYKQFHSITDSDFPFIVVPEAANLLETGHLRLHATCDEAFGSSIHQLGMIVIDTLNRSMPGGDENSSQDMGKVVANAAKLAELTQAFILIVHHSGKDSSKGARGHSSLRAAVDVELEVKKDGEIRRLLLSKSRDGQDGIEYANRLEIVKLGIDEDLEPITSCVAVPGDMLDAASAQPKPQGRWQEVIMEAIQTCLDEATPVLGEPAISVKIDILMAKVKELSQDKSTRWKEPASRALEKLTAKKLLKQDRLELSIA